MSLRALVGLKRHTIRFRGGAELASSGGQKVASRSHSHTGTHTHSLSHRQHQLIEHTLSLTYYLLYGHLREPPSRKLQLPLTELSRRCSAWPVIQIPVQARNCLARLSWSTDLQTRSTLSDLTSRPGRCKLVFSGSLPLNRNSYYPGEVLRFLSLSLAAVTLLTCTPKQPPTLLVSLPAHQPRAPSI